MSIDPVQSMIDDLAEEKKCLDHMLDEALEQFAEYEEGMNLRWKTATDAEIAELMNERSRVEEELGVVGLVERIDRIRERLNAMRAQLEGEQAA